MIDLNSLAKDAHKNAVKRGKSTILPNHKRDVMSICEELFEFNNAKENKLSEHLPIYTEAEEELADILIGCMTELQKRGVDIEVLITDKIRYNENRKNDKC